MDSHSHGCPWLAVYLEDTHSTHGCPRPSLRRRRPSDRHAMSPARQSLQTALSASYSTWSTCSPLKLFCRPLHGRAILSLPTPQSVRASLSPRLRQILDGHPSLLDIPVQWGEQDTFGHVNNVSYLRYFESARLAYFDHVLKPFLSQQTYLGFITGKGVGPIVKSIAITYRSPMWYPDVVTVGTRILPADIQKDRFTQSFVMVSRAQDRIVAEGNALVVMFDYKTQSKTDISDEILDAYRKGEAAQNM